MKTAKKFVLVGDPECGKTSLLLKFIRSITDRSDKKPNALYTEEFEKDPKPTVDEQYEVNMDVRGNREYNMLIHDTAGHSDYDRFRWLSYSNVDCFLVCFAIDSAGSFYNACDKWIPEIRHVCRNENIPYILVGMKSDLRDDEKTAERLRKRREGFVTSVKAKAASIDMRAQGYLECSAKNHKNVDDVFQKAFDVSIVTNKKQRTCN